MDVGLSVCSVLKGRVTSQKNKAASLALQLVFSPPIPARKSLKKPLRFQIQKLALAPRKQYFLVWFLPRAASAARDLLLSGKREFFLLVVLFCLALLLICEQEKKETEELSTLICQIKSCALHCRRYIE